MISIANKISATPKGHQMMMIYKVDKVIKTKLSDLQEIKKFYDKYQQFKKGQKDDF